MGGGMLYKAALPFCDRLYITKVFKDFEADTFFPEIDLNTWTIESESEIKTDPNNSLEFQFLVYKRK